METNSAVSVVYIEEVLDGSGQGCGVRSPAARHLSLLARHLNLDRVDYSGITRSVLLEVVPARVVCVGARTWELGGRHDTVAFSAKIIAEAVGTRAANQVFEACIY